MDAGLADERDTDALSARERKRLRKRKDEAAHDADAGAPKKRVKRRMRVESDTDKLADFEKALAEPTKAAAAAAKQKKQKKGKRKPHSSVGVFGAVGVVAPDAHLPKASQYKKKGPQQNKSSIEKHW